MQRFVRLASFVLFSAAVGMVAAPAEGATACFDWSCDESTLLCDFDTSCSTGQPYIWKFHFTWGDGTQSNYSAVTSWQHQYTSSDAYPHVRLLVVPWGESMTEVTCQITVYNQIGPPVLPTEGRCTE